MNHTTARHPRSRMEAFRNTVEYGAAIEVPTPQSRLIEKLKSYALAIGIGIVLAMIFGSELAK